MATGWPMKTSYANGDVYSASDVNDITGTVNLLQTSTLSRQAGKNVLINGAMDIWQRGTSAAGGFPTYLADRWMNYRDTTGSTFSRQVTGDTTNLPNIQYCQRIQRNSGNTSTSNIFISQSVETVNSIPLAGQTVTVSFYARKGADFSAASSLMTIYMTSGTGTDQNAIQGFTGNAIVINTTKTLTTTWQRFTATGTVAATATQVGLGLYYTPVGTAGTNDYMEITGVQLELGSYATTFSRAGGTIQGELAACQRYYYQVGATTGAVDILMRSYNYGSGSATVTVAITHPVVMRIAPTIVARGDINDGTNKAFDTVVSNYERGGWAIMNSVTAGGYADLNYVTASAEL